MNKDDNSDDNQNEESVVEVFNLNEKTDYANLKATELLTVQRLYPPKPATLNKEVTMQSLKDKMLNKIREYRDKRCNKNGWVKERNISKTESEGIEEIKDKIKKKDIVVFTTDKSKRLTADSVENYSRALDDHVKNDTVIDEKKVRQLEVRMNQHLGHYNKMFKVGATWKHQDRIAGASTSTNVPPPPKYGLRKNHKTVLPGREKYGPAQRPVCGAREAPNSKFGHFLSLIINNFADSEENKNECMSSEEMRAAFEKFNEYEDDIREGCRIISMDVKALFPSMKWDDIISAVKEMILRSEMTIEDVDWGEVAKYIAVMVTQEEIDAEGLSHVIPKRKKNRTRKITINYLRQKNNDTKWAIARRPGVVQKRKMLALAVSVGVQCVMSSHTYMVGDTAYLQTEGGAIGLELTGAVSRPFMQKWDRNYLKQIKAAGIDMKMYERYVDDSNQVAKVPPNEYS